MWLLRKLYFSTSLYTFKKCISCLARPPQSYFSRIKPICYYTFPYKRGLALFSELSHVSTYSTIGAYHFIIFFNENNSVAIKIVYIFVLCIFTIITITNYFFITLIINNFFLPLHYQMLL